MTYHTNTTSAGHDAARWSEHTPPRYARLLIGGVTFWLLFAGFFLYHFLASQDIIPRVAGGLFSIVLIIALPGLVWGTALAFRRLPGLGQGLTAQSSILFFTWAIFWLAIHVASEPDHPAHLQLLATLVLTFGLLMLVFNLPVYSRTLHLVCGVTLFVIGLLSLAYIDSTTLMIIGSSDEESASYQGMARGLMVIGAFVICGVPRLTVRFALAAFATVALFFTGARSELYGFIAAFATMEGVISRRSPFAQAALVILLVGLAWIILQNLDVLAASRQLQIFDLSQSTSWVARQYMAEYAERQILAHPFAGVYGGHWDLGEGDYAHNALSAWVSLGFIGFVLFVFTSITATVVSIRALVSLPASNIARLATLITSSNLLLISVAKPLFWEMPGLGWGLAILAGYELRTHRLAR